MFFFEVRPRRHLRRRPKVRAQMRHKCGKVVPDKSVYTRVHAYAHIHTHIHTCMHACMHIYNHICMCIVDEAACIYTCM